MDNMFVAKKINFFYVAQPERQYTTWFLWRNAIVKISGELLTSSVSTTVVTVFPTSSGILPAQSVSSASSQSIKQAASHPSPESIHPLASIFPIPQSTYFPCLCIGWLLLLAIGPGTAPPIFFHYRPGDQVAARSGVTKQTPYKIHVLTKYYLSPSSTFTRSS